MPIDRWRYHSSNNHGSGARVSYHLFHNGIDRCRAANLAWNDLSPAMIKRKHEAAAFDDITGQNWMRRLDSSGRDTESLGHRILDPLL